MMGYNPKRLRYKRDVAKAKQLLAEAGYPTGFSTSLIYSVERRAEFEQESVLLQSFLKDIGVNVRIEKMTYSAQLARHVAGTHDLALMVYMAGTGAGSFVIGILIHWLNVKLNPLSPSFIDFFGYSAITFLE
jgi:ABC-type transport system substrate-binding protein